MASGMRKPSSFISVIFGEFFKLAELSVAMSSKDEVIITNYNDEGQSVIVSASRITMLKTLLDHVDCIH